MVKRLPIDNPPNPWSAAQVEFDVGEPPRQGLEVYEDASRSILSENDSPDLPFRYSLNPYRGCLHACAYCYARPTHEYLGFGAGTDFDRRIVIKREAAALLRAAFERPSWTGETILFSGNTDCYQPLEASLGLTRDCLAVCAEYRNPVHVITKAALIERDLALLEQLHRDARLGVTISVPLWQETAARALEPGAPTPARRMETVRRLASAGLHVTVNIGPLIPGLSDRDLPRILEHSARAGAKRAALILLRLPGPVLAVFEQRLHRELPLVAGKVMARMREARPGELQSGRFFERMTGRGEYFRTLQAVFETTARRLGLELGEGGGALALGDPATNTFRRPTDRGGQLRLFDPRPDAGAPAARVRG